MDIFGRCNGGSSGSTVAGSGAGSVRTSSNESAAGGGGTSSGGASENGGSASGRMQLTGASAPGAAASPESGVSPLTDAYTKMTSDILAERTLGDFVSEHPGELVRTGKRQRGRWKAERDRESEASAAARLAFEAAFRSRASRDSFHQTDTMRYRYLSR